MFFAAVWFEHRSSVWRSDEEAVPDAWGSGAAFCGKTSGLLAQNEDKMDLMLLQTMDEATDCLKLTADAHFFYRSVWP